VHAAPQTPRLLRALDGIDAPVVQVWGWPGSGRAALLSALLERDGALALAPAVLESATSARMEVRRAVDASAGRRQCRSASESPIEGNPGAADGAGRHVLVCPGLPRAAEAGAALRALAEAIPADWSLVVTTDERRAFEGLLAGLVTPRDLALRPEEVAALWRTQTGSNLSPTECAHLVRMTDGWWRVLALLAQQGSIPRDDGALVARPEVADFLRLQVLADVPDEDRATLANPHEASDAAVHRLREGRGLLLEDSDGTLRPPAPLAALLARDGRGAESRPIRRRRRTATGTGPGDVERSYRLRLLGHPEVERLGEDGAWEPLRFTLKRGLRLLAYLATSSERSALREELIEALWPEDDREVIERNFHPTLSHLRRDLRGEAATDDARAELLVLRDGLYSLDPSVDWWIDAEELVRLVEEGGALADDGRDAEAIERWQAAWRLYRGPLLDGVYDPWATRRRERIQRRHLALLRDLGRAFERLGRSDQALDAYRALLVDDPLEEKVHVALMRLYAARGRRDLVRRQYERLSQLLRTELGIEPMPETAEEYHRLMIERG